MFPHFGGGGSSSGINTGDIGHSLRFRSAASAYFSRTFGTPTSQTRGLISLWYKPGWLLGGLCNAVFLATTNPTISGLIIGGTGAFGSTYENRLFLRNGGATKDYWNLVFRDPTSWYHIVVSFDTTQGTQADRAKCWVNGVEQTKGASALGASEAIGFLASGTQTINGNLATYYGDYYTSRFCLLDGQCVQQSTAAVSSFGYQNTEINEWVTKTQAQVKAVVDAGGTNSFMLDFDDGTSLTTLGYDKSTKGNNWTLNGFSLTAGTSYDRMLDVPGNSFCTASPIDLGANPGSSSLTEANLKSACSAVSGGSSTCGTAALSEGKWYWEYTPTAIGNGLTLGVTSRTSGAPSSSNIGYAFTGEKNIAGTSSAYGATYAANDIIGVAVDTVANTIEFFKNNASQGVITNATYIVPGCKPLHWNNSSSGSSTVQHNYGQAPLHASATYHSAAGGYFRYAPPSGFKALCQRNMPEPAILNPEKHFDVNTRTGTAATANITGKLFQPDFVWIKSRGRAVDHALYDSVRGVQKRLETNNTDAEVTGDTTGLTAFNSDGFTIGALDQINGTTATNSFVDWFWKAGGAAVTNNAGSISSQVSANVDAGFSIVTYTSQPSGSATVGHGLGKVPELIIAKHRNLSTGWQVYHASANATPQNGGLSLNSTAAYAANSNLWNNTAPTTSVFTSGAYFTASEPIVAYCFAEIPGFSKIFSYTGNGSADGPFVHCGFKPKFVLIKSSSSATDWEIFDAARDPSNQMQYRLYPNSASAESGSSGIDFTSNGFKPRIGTGTNINTTSATYIGIAFADVPAKYSLAR